MADDDVISTWVEPVPTRHPLSAIERLALRLLRMELADGDDFWTWQTDLLELQQDIQEQISAEFAKLRSQRDYGWIERLRWARWNSRQLGDAFAWLLLQLDRQFIHALGENSPVPIPQRHHGTIGVTSMAAGLAGEGWGFPILHDITDCLRIGDITFVKPGREPRNITVEIKTHFEGEETLPDGKTVGNYRATVMSHHAMDPKTGDVVREVDLTSLPDEPPRRRAHRQAERMRQAILKGRAAEGFIPGLDDDVLNMRVDSTATDHFKMLKKLIQEARRSGVAQGNADAAFEFLVLYNARGVEKEDLANWNVAGLTESALLSTATSEPSSVVLHMAPSREQSDDYTTLPYFLWPLPRNAVIDILRQRLLIVTLVNQAHIVDALRSAGLEVRMDEQPDGPGEIVVLGHFDRGDVDLSVEYHGAHYHLIEAIREFQAVQWLVDLLQGAVSGSLMRAEERFGGPPD